MTALALSVMNVLSATNVATRKQVLVVSASD
jgi:hypothetical protein